MPERNLEALKGICWGSLGLNLLIIAFVGYLLCYHIWLWRMGKSTYQHIVEKRQRRD